MTATATTRSAYYFVVRVGGAVHGTTHAAPTLAGALELGMPDDGDAIEAWQVFARDAGAARLIGPGNAGRTTLSPAPEALPSWVWPNLVVGDTPIALDMRSRRVAGASTPDTESLVETQRATQACRTKARAARALRQLGRHVYDHEALSDLRVRLQNALIDTWFNANANANANASPTAPREGAVPEPTP